MSLLGLSAALLAGVLTTLSPCVLPILPIIVGSAGDKNRFGPVALAFGLATSFAAVGLFVATLGFAAGLDSMVFHRGSGVLLVLFGAVLVVPVLRHATEAALAPVSRWAASVGAGEAGGGLGRQFLFGALLGAVWSPCVGPTLGAASLLAGQGKDLAAAGATMLAFGLGASAPLILIGFASRGTLKALRGGLAGVGRSGRYVLGGALIVVGLLAATGLDHVLEGALVELSPAWLTRLTSSV